MANPTPVIVDVFKFVAVRPAQLASDEDTALSLMRDERVGTPDGEEALTRIARSLHTPSEARELFAGMDLSELEPLAEAQRRLVTWYAATDAGEEPAVETSLQDSGLAGLTPASARELAGKAWDALYAAYATGPDAGALLDLPTAGLRALHAGALLSAAEVPTVADTIEALHARPVVPRTIGAIPPTESAPPRIPTDERAIDEQEHIRSMVEELGVTRRLVDLARRTPALAQPDVRSTTVDQELGETLVAGQTLTLTTAPRFLEAVGTQTGAADRALLSGLSIGTDASVPAAAGILSDHLTSLTERVTALRGDPALATALRELSLVHDLSDVTTVVGPLKALAVDPSSSPDVDVSGRIRPLGIGDLKVVKQTLLAYEPGEVAHIENVLDGESKERVHRTLDRTETTVFESTETTEETERDTQTTDRFELKKEAEQTIKEDMSIEAGVTVTGSYGPVSVTAHGDFAYAMSKEESTKSSSNFAREVVDRSVTKLQKKVKSERTTKTYHETEETNTHALTAQGGHVVGVYRWVDKRYRAQVYNYGRRLMFEFVLPEPGAYFHASQIHEPAAPPDASPPEPFLDLNSQPLTVTDISPANYRIFVSRYNAAGVTPPPPDITYIGTSFEQNEIANGHTFSKSIKDIAIPDGYTLWYYVASVSAIWENYPQFSLQVGEAIHHLLQNSTARRAATWGVGFASWADDTRDDPRGILPVSAAGYDINAFAVNVEAVCLRSSEALAKWQLQTFDKIYTAYQAMKTAYDQKITQVQAQSMGVGMVGRNPPLNLEIIKRELKKLCLTMLTGQHLSDFDAMTNPTDQPTHLPEVDVLEALHEGPVIQFFEQAFDWEQITYLLYPYFWGRKTKWVELSNRSDPDPLFMHFLQAGAARVVLPVSPTYTEAMLYFVQRQSPNLRDRIWMGGTPPTIDDPLFKSVADEIKAQTDDLAGAVPEGKPWEFTIPTTLVWLQGDSTLPTYE